MSIVSGIHACGSVSARRAFRKSVGGLVPGREYRVRLEVNKAYDYNEAWPKAAKKGDPPYSGVNGQPSLLSEARFVAGGAAARVELRPVARGSIDGSGGDPVFELSGLTTALEIIASATLVVGGAGPD